MRAWVESGRPFKPWDNRPQVPPHLLWVWEAFGHLQTCRPVGMGLGPIPWTAINEWVRAKEVADVERFERLIRAMDNEVLQRHHERREGKDGADSKARD